MSKHDPMWSCACGAHDNWANRKVCRVCKRSAPASVVRRQREAQEARRGDSSGGKGGGGAGNRGGGGGGGGGGGSGGGARTGSASRTTTAYSYADAARSGDKVAAELAEARRANERLQRQIAALQASRGTTTFDMDEDDVDDGCAAEKTREERIKVLSENLKAVAAVFTEQSEEYRGRKAELDALVRARREGKPLNVQLQRTDKRIDAQKKRLTRAEEQLQLERRRLAEVQSDIAAAEKDLEEAKSNLADMEEERKQILLRETQAVALQPAAPVQARFVSETEAWERTMGAIALRVQAPGVRAELATQVASALDTLRNLCGQLPAVVPEPPAVAALPNVPAATLPMPPAGGAAAESAVEAAGEATAAAPPAPASPPMPTDGAAVTDAGATEAEPQAAQYASDIDVDADGCEDDAVLESLTPAQRERVRQLMGMRSRRKGAPKTLAKPAEREGRTKKPSKGGE